MSANENLEKAYTAGTTAAGTNWAGTAASDTLRDQLDDSLAGSGKVHLTDPQRQYLVDRMVDESVLLGMIRRVDMKRSRVEIPRMGVGSRIMRANTAGGHAESTTMGNQVSPEFEQVVLTSSKLVVPWTITEEFLEDNPEQGRAEQLIADMMSTQAANDLEDLATNGDEGSVDPLLQANDGFLELGASGNVKDFNAAAFTTNVFEQMMRELPSKYRNRDRSKLRFFVPFDMEMDYLNTLAARMGDAADKFLSSGAASRLNYGGVPIVGLAYLPTDGNTNGGSNEMKCFLSNPDNLVWGVQRDMKLRKSTEGKQALDKDERYYALHMRCDFLIQNTEAFVLGKEITPRVV